MPPVSTFSTLPPFSVLISLPVFTALPMIYSTARIVDFDVRHVSH
jgi:hypothetical protein